MEANATIATVPARGSAPAGMDLDLNLGFFESAEFDIPLRRYMADHGLTREDALRHFKAVAQFLAVCDMTTESVAPSKELDVPWHAFILATRQYVTYCRQAFGRYVHHAPSVLGEGEPGGYAHAYAAASRLFGTEALDADLWRIPMNFTGDVPCNRECEVPTCNFPGCSACK